MSVSDRYEDRFSDAATSEVRSAPNAPAWETDFTLDGRTGRYLVKLPADVDDGFRYAEDDSLAALEDVIAQREDDPNAVTEATLQPDYTIDRTGGSSSGGAKKPPPASVVDRRERQRARMAGHDEMRTGRPWKGTERRENFCTTIDPSTQALLREHGIALVDVLDEIADLPEVRAMAGLGEGEEACPNPYP